MHSRRSRYTILLHLEDTVKQGYDKIAIRTVDTDVVDLAVTSAQRLNITELWIAFGARTNIYIYRPTRWPTHWDWTVVLLFQCFMPSLIVTRCHVLEARAIGLHGTYGVPMTKSHQLSVLWLLPRRPYTIGCVHWNDC